MEDTFVKTAQKKVPSFFIIGAQKSGTTWLWDMLNQHPGTSLADKEIHYFGSSELYAKGDDWYYNHFEDVNPGKVTGEASTTYFYDRVPYFYNESRHIEFDDSLPPIPELLARNFPEAKYILSLRDPVRRAISAYTHWMKKGRLSPTLGLKKTATEYPKLRIIEFGLYAKYLAAWQKHIPAERFRILLFEDQIIKNYEQTLRDTYTYLELDRNFKPQHPTKSRHRSWGWTRIVFNYYGKKFFRNIGESRAGKLLDRYNFLENFAVTTEDIEFLRSIYLPEKEQISNLTGLDLSGWDYGERLMTI